jgi:hypothetical protein
MARIVAAIALATALGAGGCVVGQQIPYHTQVPRLRVAGAGSVALAVEDQRNEVRSGAKRPNFCGFLRSGWGVPWEVTTASNGPLAGDFGYVVTRALRARGFRVTNVGTEPGQSEAVTLQALSTQQADRWLYIRLFDWKSDTMVNTSLVYRVTASVRDGKGNLIAQSHIVGNDAIPGSFMDPGGEMKVAVPNTTRALLERLLNDPAITNALSGVPPAAPSEAPAPQTIPDA